jgi:glycosyltransferase involved in cell wall biosynthesis
MLVGKVSKWLTRRGRGISIVIPFRAPNVPDERVRNINWLKHYWSTHLPGAEVIVGEDEDYCRAFSKSVAVNNGVKKSKGDVLVIVDADGYLPIEQVLYCAKEIRDARKRGHRLWFMPYRKFYRLSNAATLRLINSDIRKPYQFPEEVSSEDILNLSDANPNIAHRYGALIQILPREAFEIVGGWDERFRGWGGEDHAAMRATDTLYAPHKTLPTPVYHLWHPMLGDSGKKDLVDWKERRWEGQEDSGINNQLSYRYYHAYGRYKLMRKLVDEWIRLKREGKLGPTRCHPHPPKCDHKHHHPHHPCGGHSI